MAIGQQVRELQAELKTRGEAQMQVEESMRNLHLGISPIITLLETQLVSLGKHQVLSFIDRKP